MPNNQEYIQQMKEYATLNNVPIIEDEGLEVLLKIINEHSNVENILEIGCAIGYSAAMMHLASGANITTIERDENLYNLAKNNIEQLGLTSFIDIIFSDALELNNELLAKYDVIYIDGAKAQYKNFLKKYEINLADGGIIIFDNLNFHGLVDQKLSEIGSRNLRQLVRKIKDFNTYLEYIEEYDLTYYEQGDGIGVLKKNDK